MKPFYKKIRNKTIINTRSFIFGLNDKFPLIGRPLRVVWSAFSDLRFIAKKKALKLSTRLKYSADKLDLDKICWVNPQNIEYYFGDSFNIWHNYGKVRGGNWDLSKKNFENLDIYQAFKKVLREKRNGIAKAKKSLITGLKK